MSRFRFTLGYLSLGRFFCGAWVAFFCFIGTIGFFGSSPWYFDVIIGLIVFLGIIKPSPWIFYLQVPSAIYGALSLGHFSQHLILMICIFVFWLVCFVCALVNSFQLGRSIRR